MFGARGTGHIKAILGPTNTGKTHYALERMCAHRSGIIGLPLRLLAREIYQKLAKQVGAGAVALVTGEERIVPPDARYWVATVEAMPRDVAVDCVVVDEIQTATHLDRGHIFTERILNARGTCETLLLGAGTMAPVVATLLPEAEIVIRPRLSRLSYAGAGKITRQPARSAIVAFSTSEVYAIAELVRRQRGGAAVVTGGLSPRTRNAQVALYENGDVDFLVATDAIGMGLNLDINHVAFAANMKFDGRQMRPLVAAEFAQIAGRAGRHKRDGTFGSAVGADMFSNQLVTQLEAHDFEPVKVLQWRNSDLDFSSFDALLKSLEVPANRNKLTNVPKARDQAGLEFLMHHPDIGPGTDNKLARLAWDCASLPDYRRISPAQHGEIIATIFMNLRKNNRINEDWIAGQVNFCDNEHGEIDTLSNRIRQIRTWTFVANRKNWLKDPAYWRERTGDIENRLSDALHERLTRRFIDRRTSVLIRHLRDKSMTTPEISRDGAVSLEGQLIGSIEGFRFALASQPGTGAKNLRSAANLVIAPEIKKRAEKVIDAPNNEFLLTADGHVRWRGEIIAELVPREDLFSPRLVILADESLVNPELDGVQDRLDLWLRHTINTQLEQIMALRAPADLQGTARGVAFRLAERLGVCPRTEITDEVKSLDQTVRGIMRKMGIKFGAWHIYLPATLKPAPRELALILWALKNGGVRQKGVRELPLIILSGRTSVQLDPDIKPELYQVAGFKVTGNRAVRVDILERLADIIRPLVAFDTTQNSETPPAGAAEGNGFRVTGEMTSLLGCAGAEFSMILNALGYEKTIDGSTGSMATSRSDSPASESAADPANGLQILPETTANAVVAAASGDMENTGSEPMGGELETGDVWCPSPRRNTRSVGKNRIGNHKKSGRIKGRENKPNRIKNNSGKQRANQKSKPVDPDSPFAVLAALKK